MSGNEYIYIYIYILTVVFTINTYENEWWQMHGLEHVHSDDPIHRPPSDIQVLHHASFYCHSAERLGSPSEENARTCDPHFAVQLAV